MQPSSVVEKVVISNTVLNDKTPFINSSKFNNTKCKDFTCLSQNKSEDGIKYFKNDLQILKLDNFITLEIESKYFVDTTLAAGVNLNDINLHMLRPKILKIPIFLVPEENCLIDFIRFDFSDNKERLECICPKLISDFSTDDFTGPFSVEKLCEAIKEDKFRFDIAVKSKPIEWLNEILKINDFYDKVFVKKNTKYSNDIETLATETKSYRPLIYSQLDNEKQNTIRKLNKKLLEEIYPKITPKCKYNKKFCKEIENNNSKLNEKAKNIAYLIRDAIKEPRGVIPFFKYSTFLDFLIWKSNFKKHLDTYLEKCTKELYNLTP